MADDGPVLQIRRQRTGEAAVRYFIDGVEVSQEAAQAFMDDPDTGAHWQPVANAFGIESG